MEIRDQQAVILLVLVLYGPRFSKSYLPWSGSVHRYLLDRPLHPTFRTLNFPLDNPISSWPYCSPFSCFGVQKYH